MASKTLETKIQEAKELIEQHYLPMDQAAALAGISEVYFRRIVEKHETEEAPMRSYIFGKQVMLRSIAEQLGEQVALERAERERKAAERREAKANKQERTGPTVIELRYMAQQYGLSHSRKNKQDLIDMIAEHEAKLAEEASDVTEDAGE